MNGISHIEKGIWDAMLLSDSLNRLQEQGIAVIAERDVTPHNLIEIRDFSPQIRFQALRMQHVYVAFFCLENAVRELISQRLIERHGPNWWDTKVPQKIKENVEKLKEKERTNRYLSSRSVQNIGYTFFGNLGQIIIANWSDFIDLFPEQAWINSRFADLEACRNIIMHTNVLPEIEISRIDSIVRDWLSQVG
ncbi:MAG TPA: Swt1 family HEPN domain-containing protein [Hydrogenophaga sp.]